MVYNNKGNYKFLFFPTYLIGLFSTFTYYFVNMNDAAALRMENMNPYINGLHDYIATHFPDGMVLFSQISVKVLIVFIIFWILDWFQRKVLLGLVQKLVPKTNNVWLNTFMKKDVFTSFFHLVPLGVCYLLVPLIFYHHPQSFHILDLVFSVFLTIFLAQFFIRVIDAYIDVKGRDQNYRTVVLKTFSELFKILIILFACFISISILFDLTSSKIFTFLGAIMAVILLVFKDPILGFVAGLNIASSKNVKVGDQISVPKYSIEGSVKDINLITTKIQNADKTVSTIPTYDLISTEVKNFEAMRSSNTRRIKRSLLFNFKSFRFVDEDLFNDLMQIELLQDYLQQKKGVIDQYAKSGFKYPALTENESSFTNMGVFRKYVQMYLKNNTAISKRDIILVRQLEPTAYGMPVEIYCFTTTSDFKKYEAFQAAVFEHLITIIPQFRLELVLITPS